MARERKVGRDHNQTGEAERLRAFVLSLERLDEEIAGLNAEKSDVFSEAKRSGYDTAAIRAALKYRRDPDAFAERSAAMLGVLAMLGDVVPDTLTAAALPAPSEVLGMPGPGLDGGRAPAHARVHAHEGPGEAGDG